MGKCDSCKYSKHCESFCFYFAYEPSIKKLLVKKIKKTIIRILKLEEISNE